MEIFGTIFAGLGLFFIGVKLISSNLKAMSGGAFRRLIARVTQHPVSASVVGTLGGALTQSTNAMTFIVISMVTSGMVALRKAVPIVIWANLGTSALVLLATLDMHVMILFLLGITGLGFYFDLDKSSRYRYLLGALLGIGMLFYGLDLIKAGAAPLQALPFVRDLLSIASQSFLLAFVIGVLVTLVVQSSATVSVIAVTLISVGLLNLDQSVMIVFGASLGSGLSVLLLGSNLNGTGRQLALFQVLLKLVGLIILVPLFLIETWTHQPLLLAALQSQAPSIDTQVALIYLLLQLVSCIAMSLLSGPALHLAQRLSPASPEEALSSPRYLYAQAIDEAESALALVHCEQKRLLKRLPLLLDAIREDDDRTGDQETESVDHEALYRASGVVASSIDSFLTELTERTSAHSGLEGIVNLQSRNSLLSNLQDSCMELVESLRQPAQAAGAERIRNNIAEGLHALLDTLASAFESGDPGDLDLVLQLSSDRSAVMERIRADLLGKEADLSLAEKQQFLDATSLVERITWLVRRYLKLAQRR
ncbi:Na/Pi cotransporter family protein [Halochromatium sp.]